MIKILKMAAAGIALLAFTPIAGAADFNWRYVGANNAAHPYSKILSAGFARIAERTGGRLAIEYISFGETPYKLPEALTILRDGLVDMVEYLPSAQSAATYPLLAGPELPFLSTELQSAADFQEAKMAAWNTPTIAAYKKSILDQYNAVSLATAFYDPLNLWFTDVVTDLEGIRGQKVRVTSPEFAEFISAAGGSPVTIAPADVYTGLQRGTVDGAITGAAAVISFKWNDILKSELNSNFTMSSFDILVSRNGLESLPGDVRAVLEEEARAIETEIRSSMAASEAANQERLAASGLTVTKVAPEFYQELRRIAVEQVYPAWARRAGPDAEKVLSEIQSATTN